MGARCSVLFRTLHARANHHEAEARSDPRRRAQARAMPLSAAAIQELCHDVRLTPPAYVKPFVKRQKNDTADAEAIAEAAARPTMPFVVIKTEEQQARSMAFRTRDCLTAEAQRTRDATLRAEQSDRQPGIISHRMARMTPKAGKPKMNQVQLRNSRGQSSLVNHPVNIRRFGFSLRPGEAPRSFASIATATTPATAPAATEANRLRASGPAKRFAVIDISGDACSR